jgi:hypothetical protein
MKRNDIQVIGAWPTGFHLHAGTLQENIGTRNLLMFLILSRTPPVYKAKVENIFWPPGGNENDRTLIEAIQ